MIFPRNCWLNFIYRSYFHHQIFIYIHRIGWWENLRRKPLQIDGETHGFRFRFSLQPIHWHMLSTGHIKKTWQRFHDSTMDPRHHPVAPKRLRHHPWRQWDPHSVEQKLEIWEWKLWKTEGELGAECQKLWKRKSGTFRKTTSIEIWAWKVHQHMGCKLSEPLVKTNVELNHS